MNENLLTKGRGCNPSNASEGKNHGHHHRKDPEIT